MEEEGPYALFGDNPSGKYHHRRLREGWHTLSATAFTGRKASGTGGPTLTIQFEVINQRLSAADFTAIEIDEEEEEEEEAQFDPTVA